jgi:hypothetical protein
LHITLGGGTNQLFSRFVTEAVEESGISEDHPLHSLVKSLSKRLIDARSDSTVKNFRITLHITLGGGTNQLFSPNQFCVKESTASVF